MHVDDKGRVSKSIGVSDGPQIPRRTIVELSDTGQPELFMRITISALPDNVLLEIFDFYLDVDQWLRFIDGKGHEA